MASQGSTSGDNRLSFAKIAAMHPPSHSEDPVASDEINGLQSAEKPASSETQGPKDALPSQESSNQVPAETNPVDRNVESLSRAMHDVHILGKKGQESPDFSEGRGAGALKREASFEDDRTHLSNSSTKQTSFDSKSMASVTTFAMDEKDSLRPDDSASVQAVDEEESLSGVASGAPNSLTGSEAGARGFRDLQRARATLQNMGSGYDGSQRTNGAVMPESVSNNYVVSNPDAFSGGQPISMHPFPLDPDEKLLEAMKSPKDRLLILQLEDKVRNFIEKSTDQSLELPPSNAFGRLLAHKLGDYYHLTHFVDNNVTSVRLHRTPFCRLPTPLSALHAATNSTPPPAMPAMKIMRRTDSERPSAEGSTAASSGFLSKNGSEAGDSGNDGERGSSSAGATPAKDRMILTREEREAKYHEVRERIFRDFPDSKSSDNTGDEQSANMSRSSSTSGRKKTQRQKTPHDDSFEVRSQFNAYYPGMHYAPGALPYNAAMNDPSFPNQPCMVGPGVSPPGMGYVHSGQNGSMFSAPMNPMPQYPMPTSPQMAASGPWPNGAVPQQSPYSGYATINQSPAMAAAKPSPALSNYSMPGATQFQQTPSAWSSSYHGGYQQTAPRTHPPVPWPNYSSQPLNPTSYPYTQYPGQPMNPGLQNLPGTHPLPGSFPRAPFNPQTRSFVPGGAPLARHPSKGTQNGINSYPTMQASVPAQGALLGGRDSIAKWGTPSHLPPKPPPSEVPSDFDLKHRAGGGTTHSYPSNNIPNPKNGPLVVSGGTALPRAN